MKVQSLLGVLRRLVQKAAGADGALTKVEARKLPKFLADSIEAVRVGGAKVELEPALEAIRTKGPSGLSPGLEEIWRVAQTDAQGVVKGPGDLSQAERERITDPAAKAATVALWDGVVPEIQGVPLVDLRVSQLEGSTRLLQQLVRLADNGDGLTRDVELRKANFQYRGAPDLLTTNLLVTASNRAQNKGDPTVEGLLAELELALAEILAGNTDGNGTVTAAELGKHLTQLGGQLALFAVMHKGHKLADFSFEPEKIYVPTRPFYAPANADAATYLDALIRHVNAFSNDNKMPGSPLPTRYVMSEVEAKGMAKELEKQSRSRGRAVLRKLEERVAVAGQLHDPPGVYFTPPAVEVMNAQAKRLGITCQFVGPASPPSFDFY